jgi:iron complex transport system substrate-binding protein
MRLSRWLALLAAVLMPAAIAATEPIRLVSLAPHLTELAFSAGAGDRVIATVEFSDYPEAARRIPRIGDAFRIDYERLLALRPDAVLVWQSGTPIQTIERVRALGFKVIEITIHRLDEIPAALRTIGGLAGTEAVAEEAAKQFEREIAELRARYTDRERLSVFVQINDRPLYTVNGEHIISEVLELCGGRNVFASLSELAPAIGIEAVIAASPQVILATDRAVADPAQAWARWRSIPAVRNGNVYTVRADDIARSTTRLSQGARQVCRMLDTARQRLGLSVNR